MKKFLLISFIIFTSCKINFTADLYTSDLIELAKSNNPEIILLPMEIEFQVASCEDLNDEKRIMSTYFSDFEFLGCDINAEDFSSYAKAKVTAPVSNSNSISNNLIGFHAYLSDDKEYVYVDAIINDTSFKELKNYVYEQTFQELKLSESKLTINLNNDLRDVTVWIMPSYVDSTPIAVETEFELQKRQKLIIETSNVSNSYLEEHFWTPILSIVHN